MEVTSMIFRPNSCIHGTGSRPDSNTPFKEPSISSLALPRNRAGGKFFARPRSRSGNDSHLQYYVSPVSGGKRKEKEKKSSEAAAMKKKKRLIKELSRNLLDFSAIGFGIETEEGLLGEIRTKINSEAANVLLEQLQQLRVDAKEKKRKRKEEKTTLKAAWMKDMSDGNATSCSHSESSDSESEEMINMNLLKKPLAKLQINQSKGIQGEPDKEQDAQEVTENHQGCCTGCNRSSELLQLSAERIEVCMGGKCKKSGGAQLLEELEKKINVEGAVVVCKCMGKCKDGPNVRLLNQHHDNNLDKERPRTNILCSGIGLEDVEVIVPNFMGNEDIC